MTNEFSVSSFDQTKLFAKKDIPLNPKAVVLVVHGLCEHLGRYNYFTQRLFENDFAVYRFDHRGHGRSEGNRVFYQDFNEILDDVNAMAELAKEENPGLPIFVFGHSMGGFAVTNYGIKYPDKVSGIITSGALTRNNFGIGSDLPPSLPLDTYFPNELGAGVCSDTRVVEAYANDPLVEKQVSAGLFYSLFNGVSWGTDNSSSFKYPVLILHGANDGIVSEKDSRDFFGDIVSSDKSLIIYPHLFHEILNESVKEEIISDIIRWISKRI